MFVTCPLWLVLENGNVSIIDMNEKNLQFVTFLDDASQNVAAFMCGDLLMFGENTHLEKGPIYNSLIGRNTFDPTVEMFLQVLLSALCKHSRKLFADHLPGGKLNSTSEEMKLKLDHLIRTRPSTKTLAAEACLMFLNNRTLSWLESKDTQEQHELMKKTSKGVKNLREKYKSRLKEIKENRSRVINETLARRVDLRREKLRKQELYTTDILKHGLWQSESQIDNMVLSYVKKL
ncbi:unnamed protein product [Mytilus coruscus]|uniref:Uncharacterized protein n=1 Tax=Mytilus coruscus TaxID=42192 RepID=A0A6J8BBE0_MYTCO|nr:unnamed protein product [Mytilus coruscus]